jgi:hypothetical protein
MSRPRKSISYGNLSNVLNDVDDITNKNLYKLLNRGESLNDMITKSQSLKNSAILFKKSAKTLNNENEKSVDEVDYRTENNNISLSEYENQLLEMIDMGEYQYALDKASQLGLLDIVNKVIDISKKHPLHLDLSLALKSASFIGHLYVVEALIDNDIDNERNHKRIPRPSIKEFFPFYEGQKSISYSNIPLTIESLKSAILQAVFAKHFEVKIILETYYLRTCLIKGGDCKPVS